MAACLTSDGGMADSKSTVGEDLVSSRGTCGMREDTKSFPANVVMKDGRGNPRPLSVARLCQCIRPLAGFR
jgi:hypothetical protein